MAAKTRDTLGVERPSLFEFAGGEPVFLALADAHHRRCLADPVLSHPFEHPGQPDHVERLAAYWAEVFGGPPLYTERFGGHSAMLGIHAGQGGGADLGELFLACFVGAMDDANLPSNREFRDALRSYMAWAVDEVVSYAPAKSKVTLGLPVPRWGWEGLQAAAGAG